MHIAAFITSVWMTLASLLGLWHGPSAPASLTGTATTSSAEPSAKQAANAPGTTAQAGASVSMPVTGSPWQTTLALGDDKYTTAGPQKGYIYLCHVMTGGHGAEGSASWIHGSTWIPSEKVAVTGSVSWPTASYSMTVSGANRVITTNGLPTDHPSGVFPIQRFDPAYKFDANPNSIKAQQFSFTLPAAPAMLAAPDCIYGQVGIMNDGVPLFDGFDAEYRDAVAHETQDTWEAHPDQESVYHYHGFEDAYVKDVSVSTVVGFAFDGYPITGPKLADGTYVNTNDLDECHGLTSTVTLDGKSVSTYHYVLTQDFPYSVSCFRGASHEPRPGALKTSQSTGGNTSTQSAGSSSTQTPPAAAVSACSGSSSGAACSFTTPNGTISGSCKMPPGQSSLACVPQ